MLYKDLIKKYNKDELPNIIYLTNNYISFTNDEKSNKKNIGIGKIIKFKIAMHKLKSIPIQYVIGNVDFYGYTYKVNKRVLIPRFETEELVENTINYIKDLFDKEISILDLGAGSGCIGITLKKELKYPKVTLADISKKALKVAKYNSKGEDVKILRSNIFDNIQDKYDVIISNPPYLSYNEDVMDIVKNNEPNIALYADNDGLYFYEEILKNCKSHLNNKFLIAFEIGYEQKEEIIKIANNYLKNIKIDSKKDLQGRDRMIFIMNK
jgi:release factor glutamine methyltransferase